MRDTPPIPDRPSPLGISLRSPAVAASPPRPRFDAAGWLVGTARVLSPNCDPRPDGTPVTLIVVHGISLPPGVFGGDGVERLFTNRLDPRAHPFYESIARLRVSAHFFIRRDGSVTQFVPCGLRAWHAGASSWHGRERCNDYSVGIELEGTDMRPYTARQYHRLSRVIRALQRHYPVAHVAGHSEIAPGRKTDPGPAFDWRRMRSLLGALPRGRTRA